MNNIERHYVNDNSRAYQLIFTDDNLNVPANQRFVIEVHARLTWTNNRNTLEKGSFRLTNVKPTINSWYKLHEAAVCPVKKRIELYITSHPTFTTKKTYARNVTLNVPLPKYGEYEIMLRIKDAILSFPDELKCSDQASGTPEDKDGSIIISI